MLRLIQNTLQFALAEIRVARRLVRFKAMALVLSICLLGSYAISCAIHFYIAPYTPSFVAATPLYLLENVDPIFYLAFSLSALLLVFDIEHRHERSRVGEVLQAKPVSNLESIAGRVLGCAGLLWFIVAVNVLAMQFVGLLAQLGGADFASPLQAHSIFVLLVVDAPINLIAWCSLVVLLQCVLRNRVLVVAATLVAASASYVLLIYVPYSFVDLVSPSSNDTLFISDVVPQLPSMRSILMRAGALACAAGFIAWAALRYERQDPSLTTKAAIYGLGCALVGVAAFSSATLHTLQRVNEIETWREAHQALAWENSIDLQSLSGQVRIDPATQLHFDLNLDFTTSTQQAASTLVFSFNPGMSIVVVELDGISRPYTFQNGILEIPGTGVSDPEVVHTLRVVASGIPNPRFGYFDSPLDYVLKPGIPLQVTKSFGTDSSIYSKGFVALMPGSHWYPRPGPINDRFGDTHNGLDYFELDLQIELANQNWTLVGPGVSPVEDGEAGSRYELKPSVPVPKIGLFASYFSSASTSVQGYDLSMHLHFRHAKKLKLPEQVHTDLIDRLAEFVQERDRKMLPLLHDSLMLVEVPSRLRTVGGGWRMDALNALPGVMLLKERGFPVAPPQLAITRQDQPDWQIRELQLYFQRGLGTDNLTYSLPNQIWTHATSASGIHARVLDQIAKSLLARTLWPWEANWFSPYSSMQFVSWTTPSVWQALGLSRSQSTNVGAYIHRQENEYAMRSSVHSRMATTSMGELPSGQGHQADLELLMLKSSKIAEELLEYHDYNHDLIFAWLAAVREKFAGRTYRHGDLVAMAREHGITVDPFLTEWITSAKLPGFVVSSGSLARLKNSDDGKRRLQLSFTVRNTEPVGGYVIPWFGEGEIPIHIGANVAKRINLLWEDAPAKGWANIRMDTGLSLNGNSGLRLFVPVENDVPFGEPRDRSEDSAWAPEQKGIVVDDLDEGFSVLQPTSTSSWFRPTSLATWFWPHVPAFEYVNQLSEPGSGYSPAPGHWIRTVANNAYGLHRETVAVALVGRNKFVHTARFSAEIPESARWQLEFHVHYPYWADRFNLPTPIEFADFKLRIDDGSISREVDFDPTTTVGQWKTVGEFDLPVGTVRVDVGSVESRSFVYADAIRWSPID